MHAGLRAVGQIARAVIEELEAVHAALVSDGDIRYPETMLIDQLQYLYGMTTSADQRPGADAFQRIEVLEAELGGLVAGVERIVEGSLQELEAH
jgi:hypothetical protein